MQELMDWLNQRPPVFALFIIAARIVDVSIGTVRTLMVVRGYRGLAAMLGFVEVIVWVSAVAGVLNAVTPLKVVAYATGFSLGNIVGIWLEQKVALGHQVVTFISKSRLHNVAFALRLAGFEVTQVPARGKVGRVAMCFTAVPRRRTRHAIALARNADHGVFATVQDVRVNGITSGRINIIGGWRDAFKRK